MAEYIEREEAEKRLFQRAEIANSAYIDQTPYQIMMLAQNVVHLIPSTEVAPVRHGRWKPYDLAYGRSVYYCTACNHSTVVPTALNEPIFNYCPNCGAKMDGGD